MQQATQAAEVSDWLWFGLMVIAIGSWLFLRLFQHRMPRLFGVDPTKREAELLAQIEVHKAQNAYLWERVRVCEIEGNELRKQAEAMQRQIDTAAVAKTPKLIPQTWRTLLVAPRTDLLLVDEEVQDVINSGLPIAQTLLGDVGHLELTREIRRGMYSLLWLATHGSADGIQLSDGLLAISELAQLVRGRFQLVVLNTCSSLPAAQMLQNETEADVICTIVEVPDRAAYRTGSLFAQELASTGNPRAAYAKVRPGGNRLYLYLAAIR